MPAKKPAGKAGAAKAGAKKGAPSAAIAAMKAAREKQLEEERKLKEAEEAAEAKAKEEEQRRLQEEKQRADARKRAKEEKEALLKSGKLLSKDEQKRVDANRKKIEQMRAAGMVIPEALLKKLEGGEEPAAEDQKGKKKKACVAAPKKKKPQPKQQAAAEDEPEGEDEAEAGAADAGHEGDDWEAEAEQAVKEAEAEKIRAEQKRKEAAEKQRAEREAAAEMAAEGEAVPDDWDADASGEEDEEEEEEEEAPAAAPAGKAKPPAPAPAAASPPRQRHADPAPSPAPAAASPKRAAPADASPPRAPTAAPAAAAPPAAASPPAAEGGEKKRELRSPICTVLGHVDTGKTKLLDCIRKTNVQSGEAGGITQQIGATFMPIDNILKKTEELRSEKKSKMEIEVPGLLVIDTPGHESFENLRSRGSSLCDIAILVVDIMHGLEPQTKSSIKLLKDRKCPFVVALNKIDRLYEWEPQKDKPFDATYSVQKDHVKHEFQQRLKDIKLQFSEQGLNADLYTHVLKGGSAAKTVSLVPTSAHSGEGVADLLLLLVHLTQKYMGKRVQYQEQVQCTVLELKMIDGLGLTIDVILVNGVLKAGDTIVVCGLNGPIVTQIRALLTPQPMKEIRVKSEYIQHKEIKAAMGLKIAANDLEGAVPGTPLLVLKPGEDIESLKAEVMKDMSGVISRTQADKGVLVQASTLGALEALLSFLQDVQIPVSSVGVGPIHKKDVMRGVGVKERHPKYGVILAFDVPVSAEGQQMAEKEGIKIFTADIIYHLEDKFKAYLAEYAQKLMEKNKEIAIFPCHLKLHAGSVFNKKNPIVLGLDVAEGQLRPGTPLFTWKTPEGAKHPVPFHVGKVETIELDHKEVKVHRAGGKPVAVKIRGREETMTFGRQIDEKDEYWSEITRDSIDALKESFREEMKEEDWKLVIRLKKMLSIM
eukprot:TRINITY_DN8747_c1_g2_i1.p1 TRINITY_DN8747_c1_g2~~TRINITY_DN8747_c1_g2_i1.p1  ORF type:complete len:966 (+),score=437.51 TRINITY_DN8747_c1_g2_i1:101-2899(+)